MYIRAVGIYCEQLLFIKSSSPLAMRQCRRSLKGSTADFWYQTHKVLDVTSESMHVIDETSPSSPNHALELFLNANMD